MHERTRRILTPIAKMFSLISISGISFVHRMFPNMALTIWSMRSTGVRMTYCDTCKLFMDPNSHDCDLETIRRIQDSLCHLKIMGTMKLVVMLLLLRTVDADYHPILFCFLILTKFCGFVKFIVGSMKKYVLLLKNI